jgi:hypothetical protein
VSRGVSQLVTSQGASVPRDRVRAIARVREQLPATPAETMGVEPHDRLLARTDPHGQHLGIAPPPIVHGKSHSSNVMVVNDVMRTGVVGVDVDIDVVEVSDFVEESMADFFGSGVSGAYR